MLKAQRLSSHFSTTHPHRPFLQYQEITFSIMKGNAPGLAETSHIGWLFGQ